jgi:signal transduction histidine kinase
MDPSSKLGYQHFKSKVAKTVFRLALVIVPIYLVVFIYRKYQMGFDFFVGIQIIAQLMMILSAASGRLIRKDTQYLLFILSATVTSLIGIAKYGIVSSGWLVMMFIIFFGFLILRGFLRWLPIVLTGIAAVAGSVFHLSQGVHGKTIRFIDSTAAWIDHTLVLTATTAGVIAIALWIVRSIIAANTELVEQTKELDKRKKIAEKAAKAKEEFLSIASHEMRTPLHPIVAYADLLAGEDLEPDLLRAVQGIQTSAGDLTNRIDQILDYVSISSRDHAFDEKPFDLVEVYESIRERLERSTDIGGLMIRASTNLDSNEPFFIIGDKKRISQAITNLVDNAIKFTHRGFIKFKLRVKPVADEKTIKITIEVEDSGVGIAKEFSEKIYEPLYQIDSSMHRNEGGLGLGLSIAKLIVELLDDGSIEHYSKEKLGTRFIVQFSAKIAESFQESESDNSTRVTHSK